jgi:hypothetical protein
MFTIYELPSVILTLSPRFLLSCNLAFGVSGSCVGRGALLKEEVNMWLRYFEIEVIALPLGHKRPLLSMSLGNGEPPTQDLSSRSIRCMLPERAHRLARAMNVQI